MIFFEPYCVHCACTRKLSKILACCKLKRDNARKIHDDSVEWLKKKYGERMDKFEVPSEVDEFSECKIFKSNPNMKPEEPSGPVIVGEDIELCEDAWALLARGTSYCVVRGCQEEDARVEIETSVLKHKWDCMGQEGEQEEVNMSEEERRDGERVAQMAESPSW